MLHPRAWLTLGTGLLTVATWACSDEPQTLGTAAGPSGTSTGQGGDGAAGPSTTTGSSMGGSSQGGNGQGADDPDHLPYEVCATPSSGYPAGPYGNDLGDVLTPVGMQGWTTANATQRIDGEPFGDVAMADIRANYPNSFVMLHLAAMF